LIYLSRIVENGKERGINALLKQEAFFQVPDPINGPFSKGGVTVVLEYLSR
jgi:hypothetical protein